MKKLNVTELSNELVGKEMSFMELDNFMMESGYRTVFENGIGENVQEDGNVVYMGADAFEEEIQIHLELLESSEEDSNNFTLKVTNVEEF